MCKYCDKKAELNSSNFCGSARARVIGRHLDIIGDKKIIKWFEKIYQPRFFINYCPMCGKNLEEWLYDIWTNNGNMDDVNNNSIGSYFGSRCFYTYKKWQGVIIWQMEII